MRIPKHLLHILSIVKHEDIAVKLLDAEHIGEGSYRAAYRIGQWVFKKHSRMRYGTYSYEQRRNKIAALGVRIAPTMIINGWEIQPYLKPLTAKQCVGFYNQIREAMNYADINAYTNCGVDRWGRICVYDF